MTMQSFFAAVRKAFGPLSQKQVEGIEIILRATMDLPLAHQAYVLATAWHETAATMQPIAEYGKGAKKAYGKKDSTGKAPYGRGYVQLTWRENYVKADAKLGLEGQLAADYDLALRPDIAVQILVRGMVEGWFTGKKLRDYKPESYKDMAAYYAAMRPIVNGKDKAALIAGHALKFQDALGLIDDADPAPTKPEVGTIPTQAPQMPQERPPVAPAPNPSGTGESPQAAQPAQKRGLLLAILELIAAIFGSRKG